MILQAFLFILGLVLLVFSADLLIKTSTRLAVLLKLSTLFIGLILVAFGTSLPEAAVSVSAGLNNQPSIALGNVIGSNIANICLALGLCGMFVPIKVSPSLFKTEIPIMLVATLAFLFFCLDGFFSRFEGIVFLIAFGWFCFYSYRNSQQDYKEQEVVEKKGFFNKIKSKPILFVIFFIALLFIILSSNLMVKSGVFIANFFKINPVIIGITLFALGTSLPEIAISFTAALKKKSSLSVGNVIGSNIFNILFVIGILAVIKPFRVDQSLLKSELPFLIILNIVLVLFMRTSYTLSRKESFILLIGYILFISSIFMR